MMMNKKWMISLLVVSMMMSVGCSTGSSVEVEASSNTKSESQTDRSSDEANEINSESVVKAVEGDGTVSPEKQNTMYMGKIVTVYGNYIQIDKVDMPERTMGSRGSGADNKNTSTDEEQTNIATAMTGQAGTPGGGRPPGAGGKSGGGQEYEYTGEIVDIMIPVGSEIRSLSEESLELSYDNLKKGMIVKILVDQTMTDEFQDTTEAETFYADNLVIIE